MSAAARKYALGAARRSAPGADFYPTPPWATRALLEHPALSRAPLQSCWEPACGRGDMAEALAERFMSVVATDAHDRGYGIRRDLDFLGTWPEWAAADRFDWIITNPPFSLASDFAARALDAGFPGVALLVRLQWLESVSRHCQFFAGPERRRPRVVLIFSERVPMAAGRLERRASTATAYCWVIWRRDWPESARARPPELHWVPPGSRARLERHGDYDDDAPGAAGPGAEMAGGGDSLGNGGGGVSPGQPLICPAAAKGGER